MEEIQKKTSTHLYTEHGKQKVAETRRTFAVFNLVGSIPLDEEYVFSLNDVRCWAAGFWLDKELGGGGVVGAKDDTSFFCCW